MNTDDRLQYCITRWLDGHTLAFLPAGRKTPPAAFLRTYDAVLIGGGGILQRRGGVFRHMARWVRRAGVPVALVGVSAERMPADLRAEVRALLDVCCFACFRDQASLEQVGPHPSAFVAPDLTWLFPFPETSPGDGTAVSLRSGSGVPSGAWRAALASLPGPLRPWSLYFESGADPRFGAVARFDAPGLCAKLTFDPGEDVAAPFVSTGARPRVAILREQGVNSHLEMAAAFTRAGFDAHDVHMTDPFDGGQSLSSFTGLVACGGFSYGDVLGAGEGWAKSIRFDARLADAFAAHFARAGIGRPALAAVVSR